MPPSHENYQNHFCQIPMSIQSFMVSFPTDNFMKYKMKTNPTKIILEIL